MERMIVYVPIPSKTIDRELAKGQFSTMIILKILGRKKIMNKTVEAIKTGNKVTTEELFEVVNDYVLTALSLRSSDKKTIMSMQVNQFEKFHKDYKFSQQCHGYNDAIYLLKADDLLSVDGEYNQKADVFYITCKLKNSMELCLKIINVSGSENEIETDGFYETDVYAIQDFLDDVIHEKNEYYCILARITDVFGLDLKISSPIRTYVSTLDGLALHISDDMNTFEVPVFDDSINLFYMKETDSSKEIIVKPYGQPFMEIRMLFFCKHE
jgi:hypothetical protein